MPPGFYCRVLYDVRTATPPFWILGLGGLLCIGGALAARYGRRDQPVRRWLPLVAAILWTALATTAVVQHFALRRALNEGRTMHVEGLITEYHAVEEGKKGQESFVVDGLRFSFSDWTPSGYDPTHRHAGPLMAGSYVRIEAVDSHMARLELCAP